MARSAILAIKVIADTAAAKAGLGDVSKSVGGVQGSLDRMALPAAAALGAITVFGSGAVDAASEVEQSFGALEAVYGDQADAAKDLARDAAKANGLSSAEYAQMAATMGAALKNMGVADSELLGQTDDLIDLGADLAAQFGGSSADAVAALGSLMRGERDPIERYGVSIKEATIAAELQAQGLDDLEGPALDAAKTQATLAILTRQTADAHGAAAREADTLAGSQQNANAEWKNAQAALGEALLPAVTKVTRALSGLATWVAKNSKLVTIVVAIVGTFAVAILAANAALRVYNTLQTLWAARTGIVTAAQWLLNAALSANPIGLVVLAIVALVAAFVLAYKKSTTFRQIVDGVFRAVLGIIRTAVAIIQRLFGSLGDTLAAPFRFLQRVVESVVAAVKRAIAALARFVKPVLDAIKSGIKVITDGIATVRRAIDALPDLPTMPWDSGGSARGVPAPGAAVAPRVGGLRTVGGRAVGGGGHTFNIYGAVDPEATARQIRRILAGHAARTGEGVTI